MSILVPFLVFAIAVSHGVQMLSAVRAEVFLGADSLRAARASFRRLLLPGGIALASDTIGFITILLIKIRIIQEMAITASVGVAVVILTNLILLPVLLSWISYDERYRRHTDARAARLRPVWRALATLTTRGRSLAVLGLAGLLLAFGAWKGREVRIGDLHRGVPELRADSTYNVDSDVISSRFSIGVDLLSVIVETEPEGCIDHAVMTTIDHFAWHMRNVPGVQSVQSLATVAKRINTGWNEGSLKWHILPRNPQLLAQSVSYVPTSSGLLDTDCSVMPVLIFTTDHKAATIARIVDEVKAFRASVPAALATFRLATGNVGVMAATNEEVSAAQFPILLYVFSAIVALCLISFRSLRATLCVVLPLGLVSLLAYALMALLEIGLKVSTLPVVALGVGIGVDYGIYVFSRLREVLAEGVPAGAAAPGEPLQRAYEHTLQMTGSAVVFTGITLAIGVATWIFAPLKFQADMGVLLTFMFLVNMLGAIVALPALAAWLLPRHR
jgi:predicted RND superfamily exporter protein